MRTDTVEMPGVAPRCHWCRISLSAIPELPVLFHGHRYHPMCKTAAQRNEGLATRLDLDLRRLAGE